MAFSGGGGTGNKPFSPFTITANQAAQHQQPTGTSFAFGVPAATQPAAPSTTTAAAPLSGFNFAGATGSTSVNFTGTTLGTGGVGGGGTGSNLFSSFSATGTQATQQQQPTGTPSFAFGAPTTIQPGVSVSVPSNNNAAAAPLSGFSFAGGTGSTPVNLTNPIRPTTTTTAGTTGTTGAPGGGTGSSLFSSFSATANQATQQQPTGTSSFAFGVPATTQPAATVAAPSTTTTAAPLSGFNFAGGTGSTPVNLTNPIRPITTTAAGTTGTTGTGGAGDAQSTPTTQLSSATTTTQSNTAVSQMNFRQLQEAINKWMLDLQEQEKVFLDQATKVNAWDRSLIANGDKIAKLNESITKVKNDHTRLEHALDYLKTQQQEFEAFLEPLEAGLPVNIPVEPEREHLYSVTESVDTQLQQMAEDLKEVIRHINESNKTVDKNDPISQILRILNEHTDALQWVEDNANQVRRSLEDVSKQHQMAKKEHERSLRQMFK